MELERDADFKAAWKSVSNLWASVVRDDLDQPAVCLAMERISALRTRLVMMTAMLLHVYDMPCRPNVVARDARTLTEWLEEMAKDSADWIAETARLWDTWPCMCARNKVSFNSVQKYLDQIRLGESPDGPVSPAAKSMLNPSTPLVKLINACLEGRLPLYDGYCAVLARSARDVPLTEETRAAWCDGIMRAIEEVYGPDVWANDEAVIDHPVFAKCVSARTKGGRRYVVGGKGDIRKNVRKEIMDKLGDMLRNRHTPPAYPPT